MLSHLHVARSKTLCGLEHSIKYRKKLAESAFYISVGRELLITVEQEQHLYNFVNDFSDPKYTSGRMVISVHKGVFYFNDVDLINDIKQLSYLSKVQIYQCVPHSAAGEIYLKNSKYQYRSYFTNIYDKKHILDIANVVNHNGFHASAVVRDVNQTFWSIRNNYFVDHNAMSELTMLHLIVPGCIRKTVKIVNDK